MNEGEKLPVSGWGTGHLLMEGSPPFVLQVGYAISGGLAVWQGDIVLGSVDDMRRSTPENPHSYRVRSDLTQADVRVGAQYRWPNNIYYYAIDPQLPEQDRVTDAIAHWKDNTAVEFIARTNQSNYVYFTFDNTNSCYSTGLGMIGGRQSIVLASWGLKGNAIHEIGHSFGLYHEQARADRDEWVTVYLDNLSDPNMARNFEITQPRVGERVGQYDYGSIMHYSDDAFAKPGTKTIIPLVPTAEIGPRVGLSGCDLAAIARRCAAPVVFCSAYDQTAMQVDDGDPAAVVQASFVGTELQQWLIKATGFGSYSFVSESNQEALTLVTGQTDLSTATLDVSDSLQKWYVASQPEGRFFIFNSARPTTYLVVSKDPGDPDGRSIQATTIAPTDGDLSYVWSFRKPA
jgi:hypothetical protein